MKTCLWFQHLQKGVIEMLTSLMLALFKGIHLFTSIFICISLSLMFKIIVSKHKYSMIGCCAWFKSVNNRVS